MHKDLTKTLASKYSGMRVVVTGGASFIGSHLVDALLHHGAQVRVLDDFSSGRIENLLGHKGDLEINDVDLRQTVRQAYFAGADIVFHLAAVHGGRGYIESHGPEILANLIIDQNVFTSARANRVHRVVHASSACAYPINLQASAGNRMLLMEHSANFDTPGGAYPDGVYGWTKLMGEYQLANFCDVEMTGRAARLFTAYGERENESHAAIALIAKSILRLDPFPIWGSGSQTRNFTYVSDSVLGLLFLGIDPSSVSFEAYNIGTANHVTVMEFCEEIFSIVGWHPDRIEFQGDKPEGVASRASDNSKILRHFGWEPTTSIRNGLTNTVAWYEGFSGRCADAGELEKRLSVR